MSAQPVEAPFHPMSHQRMLTCFSSLNLCLFFRPQVIPWGFLSQSCLCVLGNPGSLLLTPGSPCCLLSSLLPHETESCIGLGLGVLMCSIPEGFQ